MAEKYSEQDVDLVARSFRRRCDNSRCTSTHWNDAREVLDALAVAGRLAPVAELTTPLDPEA